MDSAVVILVVEDEALIQELLEDALEDGGYVVRKAFSGDEAMRVLNTRVDETFSALITDIRLGSMTTASDVARHACELFPLIPVVYNDRRGFCRRLLQEAGVATTPGVDFDKVRGAGTLRISFAGSMAEMEEAVRRL